MNDIYSAGTLLGLTEKVPAVIAVAGCGGKTTFIESLAQEYRRRKVLITPTTKIFPMHGSSAVLVVTREDCLSHTPVNGIQCLGVLHEKTGKLEALALKELEEIVPRYDIVLLEADGSCGLPCKGWLPGEPVIPPYSTHTVGIVTLNALGKPADSDSVLRLPEFLQLTGLRRGETITMQAMTTMVCGSSGMFRSGIGSQFIFVNQVEETATTALAGEWLRDIQRAYPGRFAGLAWGSARDNQWETV
jgi:probable selenium-dependent hydroxylase accessory protein YqeC